MISTVYEMSYPMQTILVALLVSVFAPSLLAWLNNRSRKKEKLLDWEREDKKEKEKADKAEEVAQRLLDSNKQIANEAARISEKTFGKMQEIHTLVNSDMTAARMDQRDQTKLTLLGLRKIIQLDKDAGRLPSVDDTDAILAAEKQIIRLDAILSDRAAQQRSVELQQSEAKSRGE